MPLIAWMNALIMWSLGIVFSLHVIKNWNKPEKKSHRASEIVEILLFFLMGLYLINLFEDVNIITRGLYWSLFLFNLGILCFFLGNVIPNLIKKHSNPNFRKDITYLKFLQDLKQTYEEDPNQGRKDKIKDYTRKLLHIIQFVGYIVIHYLVFRSEDILLYYGINPIEIRNYIYFYVACIFWIMMIVGDITRMEAFECLPNWGVNWYKTSLEVDREAWTVNAVVPIILANFIWIYPDVPIQVFFIAVFVSCISDAVASFVGKNFGRTKWNKLAYFAKKTQEGTFTAAIVTIIGTLSIILLVPIVNQPIWYIISVPLGCAILFILIDMYGHFLADNLLNSIVIGCFALTLTQFI